MIKYRELSLKLLTFTIIILFNAFAIECILTGVYYFSKKKLIWFHAPKINLAATSPIAKAIAPSGLSLSPYFGYVNDQPTTLPTVTKPPKNSRNAKSEATRDTSSMNYFHAISWISTLEPSWKINNYGFQSGYDYPFLDTKPDDFVIGIFGGSVAFHYAYFGADKYASILKDLPKKLGKKRLVILNFAVGGGKQPQQLLELAYFVGLGQRFDLILNIDGFNEAYVGWLNVTNHGVSFAMPSAQLTKTTQNYFLSSFQTQKRNHINSLLEKRAFLKHTHSTTHFATIHYISSALYEFYNNRVTKLEKELSQATNHFPLLLIEQPKDTFYHFLPQLADMWFMNSVQMQRIADSIGARYLHVLQPNQYFSNKTFSAQEVDEFNVLGEGDAPLRTLIPCAYSAFIERAKNFQKYNVNFLDATPIFNSVKRTIYFDWACHFNEPGDEILDEVIQKRVVEIFQKPVLCSTTNIPMPHSSLGQAPIRNISTQHEVLAKKFDKDRLAAVQKHIRSALDASKNAKYVFAVQELNLSLDLLLPLNGRYQDNQEILEVIGNVYQHIGDAYRGMQNVEESKKYYQLAWSIYERLQSVSPDNTAFSERMEYLKKLYESKK